MKVFQNNQTKAFGEHRGEPILRSQQKVGFFCFSLYVFQSILCWAVKSKRKPAALTAWRTTEESGTTTGWESRKSEKRKSQREVPKCVVDPKPCMHMWPTPSSSARRTEPVSELLPTRKLHCSLSSIALTGSNNKNKKHSFQELKSRGCMTYCSQCQGYNAKLLNIPATKKETTPIFKKTDNLTIHGDYQTSSELLHPDLRK